MYKGYIACMMISVTVRRCVYLCLRCITCVIISVTVQTICVAVYMLYCLCNDKCYCVSDMCTYINDVILLSDMYLRKKMFAIVQMISLLA